MEVLESSAAVHGQNVLVKRRGLTTGFVPTMGYLHQGHLSLVDAARRENDVVVMSIFVNPTQFAPGEDFDRYPRDVSRDTILAKDHGVDILFCPTTETIYPGGSNAQHVWVDPGPLADHLDGASRPGHFRGVATVVTKLFNIVPTDRAYFGQKDAQQARIIQHLAHDLAFQVDIRIQPTVRDDDGLALSSRNIYLSRDERLQARALNRSLMCARELISGGERDAQVIETAMRRIIADMAPLARVDYVTIADWTTLHPRSGPLVGDCLIALALYFGTTRLIDNEIVRFADQGPVYGWR